MNSGSVEPPPINAQQRRMTSSRPSRLQAPSIRTRGVVTRGRLRTPYTHRRRADDRRGLGIEPEDHRPDRSTSSPVDADLPGNRCGFERDEPFVVARVAALMV